MAKLTWLGEDTDEVSGPSFVITYGGIKFPKGVPVEVIEKDFIARARKNPQFEVSGVPGRPPAANKLVNDHRLSEDHVEDPS